MPLFHSLAHCVKLCVVVESAGHTSVPPFSSAEVFPCNKQDKTFQSNGVYDAEGLAKESVLGLTPTILIV